MRERGGREKASELPLNQCGEIGDKKTGEKRLEKIKFECYCGSEQVSSVATAGSVTKE